MRSKWKIGTAILTAVMAWSAAEARASDFQRLSQETITVLSRKDGQDEIWIREEYRSNAGTKLRAEILKGRSVSSWEIPQRETEGTDAPLGFGSTYKTTYLEDGTLVAVETHPMWGASIVGKASDQVITVEAPVVAVQEALELAQKIIRTRSNGSN